MRLSRRLWAFVGHFATAAWLWQIGGSSIIVAFVGWGIWVLDVMPTPFLIMLLVGIFAISFAVLGWVVPRLPLGAPSQGARKHVPVQPSQPREEGQKPSLQKVRLIRNEIDAGTRTVERAVGVSHVHEVVSDTNWIAHRNELAAIPDGGDAHRLAGTVWEAGLGLFDVPVREPECLEVLSECRYVLGRRLVE